MNTQLFLFGQRKYTAHAHALAQRVQLFYTCSFDEKEINRFRTSISNWGAFVVAVISPPHLEEIAKGPRSTFESHRICNVYYTQKNKFITLNWRCSQSAYYHLYLLTKWQQFLLFSFAFFWGEWRQMKIEYTNNVWMKKKAFWETMLKNVTAKVISLLCRRCRRCRRRLHSIAIIKKWRRTEWANKKKTSCAFSCRWITKQIKIHAMVWALMRYIVVKIPNEIIMYHLIAVCGCVFFRLFKIRMHFSERTILMLFLWSDYERPSLATKLRAKEIETEKRRLKWKKNEENLKNICGNAVVGVAILSLLKMINWMCRSHLHARQSPSHKIIMASKWIINFFFIIHSELLFFFLLHTI